MDYMFMNAENFNQNVVNWNIDNVITMIQVFEGANNLSDVNKFKEIIIE